MDKEMELLSRATLCSQLSSYAKKADMPCTGVNSRLLVRGRAYLEEAIKACEDPAAADPITVQIDIPVLRNVYGKGFDSGSFKEMMRRHLALLRAGKPTRECATFFELAAHGYDDALREYGCEAGPTRGAERITLR